jgi:glycosyltransferase involved in cell wall biosynthesis
MSAAPLLLALPYGLQIGGVTTFAVRLANGMAARGRPVAVILHPEPGSEGTLEADWHRGVDDVRAERNFEDSPGDLSRFVPIYRDVARRMAAQTGRPAIIAPQLLGDCYGVAAALCTAEPEIVRVVGWQHSDIEYDTRVLMRYEPIIAKFAAVSDRIEGVLKDRLAARVRDVVNVPCGVEVGAELERREMSQRGPLRLIYAGRLEHQAKRVLALVEMSAELERRGVAHVLTVVGDGPAASEFDAAARNRRSIKRVGAAASPSRVAALLREHEALVLSSRYEGLSVSMLEAMAAGCVPILARTRSGAGQVVESGYNGEIADTRPDADERQTGAAMADAVVRFVGRDRRAMSEAAWRTVHERYSIDRHLDRVSALIDAAACEPARSWPLDKACAFTASEAAPAGSGSVPPEGAAKLRAVLERLIGRRVVIHGTGQHTIQLGAVLASSAASIVAFADDDRARHGARLWGWPIIDPAKAADPGATDVVISSWMHQDAIWERRAVYERQGLTVHRLYV